MLTRNIQRQSFTFSVKDQQQLMGWNISSVHTAEIDLIFTSYLRKDDVPYHSWLRGRFVVSPSLYRHKEEKEKH